MQWTEVNFGELGPPSDGIRQPSAVERITGADQKLTQPGWLDQTVAAQGSNEAWL